MPVIMKCLGKKAVVKCILKMQDCRGLLVHRNSAIISHERAGKVTGEGRSKHLGPYISGIQDQGEGYTKVNLNLEIGSATTFVF